MELQLSNIACSPSKGPGKPEVSHLTWWTSIDKNTAASWPRCETVSCSRRAIIFGEGEERRHFEAGAVCVCPDMYTNHYQLASTSISHPFLNILFAKCTGGLKTSIRYCCPTLPSPQPRTAPLRLGNSSCQRQGHKILTIVPTTHTPSAPGDFVCKVRKRSEDVCQMLTASFARTRYLEQLAQPPPPV